MNKLILILLALIFVPYKNISAFDYMVELHGKREL